MPLRVVHIVAGDLDGGAARGATWLHEALLDRGVESFLIYSGSSSREVPNSRSVAFNKWGRFKARFFELCDLLLLSIYKNRTAQVFSTGLPGWQLEKLPEVKKADVVNLHWISSFVSIPSISKAKRPVVWTIRDMWPITGGCHYSMGCEKFLQSCGGCPQLQSRGSLDVSKFSHLQKKRVHKSGIALVAISPWISQVARSSSITSNAQSISVIPNGIDTSEYQSVDKLNAREILGLPKNKKILLAGSQNIGDFYKGIDLLEASLQKFDKNDFVVLLFGREAKNEKLSAPQEIHRLGFLSDSYSLRLAYSAADVFVAPSRMEAFGKTIIESMASKTPVVAFNTGGPASIITQGVEGYLARPFEPESLAEGIRYILGMKSLDYSRMREACLRRVVEDYSIQSVAEKYESLYRSLLKGASLESVSG